jgi:hypothetical protein
MPYRVGMSRGAGGEISILQQKFKWYKSAAAIQSD